MKFILISILTLMSLGSIAIAEEDLVANPRVGEKFLHRESFRYYGGQILYGDADLGEPMEMSALRVQFACTYGVSRFYQLEYWNEGDHHHYFSNYDGPSQSYTIATGTVQHLSYAVQPYIFQRTGVCTVTFSAIVNGYPGPQAKWTKISDIGTGEASEVVIPPMKLNQKVGGVKVIFPDSPNCSNIDPSFTFFDGTGKMIQPPRTTMYLDQVDKQFVFSFGLKTITEIGSLGVTLKGKPGCSGTLHITGD